MNIFNLYLDKIKKIVLKHKNDLELTELNNFSGIQVESPPVKFDCDLSTNLPMILGKINKKDPKFLAENIKKILLK